MRTSNARKATCKVMEMMDEGALDPRAVADMCLMAMSEDDVAEMAHNNAQEKDSMVKRSSRTKMKRKKTLTRNEREALDSYQAFQRKWDAMPKFARVPIVAKPSTAIPVLTTPPGRSSGKEHKSVDTGHSGGTKPVHGLRYTGTKIMGVAVMHKSNLVPVYKGEDAIDIARMRRG